MNRIVIGLLFVLSTTPMSGGDPPGFETILLPVWTPRTEGSYGTIWTSELVSYNASDQPLEEGADFRFLDTCALDAPDFVLQPRLPTRSCSAIEREGRGPGRLVYVAEHAREQLLLGVTLYEVSSSPFGSDGVEMPVVREDEIFEGAFDLLNVTADVAEYRSLLRVYDTKGTGGGVRVELWSPRDTMNPVAVRILAMTQSDGDGLMIFPSYAELPLSPAAIPELIPGEYLRVRIVPLSENPRLWGFVSMTNNQTQRINLIRPQ